MIDDTATASVTGVIASFNAGDHTLESPARLTGQHVTEPYGIVVDNALSHGWADALGKVFPRAGVIRRSGILGIERAINR